MNTIPFVRIDQDKTPASNYIYNSRNDVSISTDLREALDIALEIIKRDPQVTSHYLEEDFNILMNVSDNVSAFIHRISQVISTECQERGIYIQMIVNCDDS